MKRTIIFERHKCNNYYILFCFIFSGNVYDMRKIESRCFKYNFNARKKLSQERLAEVHFEHIPAIHRNNQRRLRQDTYRTN